MDNHEHHGGMDMGDDHCSMNMLFNVGYHNLCIVFPSWHIRSLPGFLFSLLAIVFLGIGYEAVREISRRIEMGSSNPIALTNNRDDLDQESGSLLAAGRNKGETTDNKKSIRALMYAIQVFYSFFVMLLFMTYNLWIMLAVAAGAFAGYMIFGGSSATKSIACH